MVLHTDASNSNKEDRVIRVTAWDKPEASSGPSCYGAGLKHKDWCEKVAAELRADGIDAVVSKPNLRDEIAVFRRK